MSLTIDDLKKGIAFYESARKQASADIEFNGIVIEAIENKIAVLEKEKEKNGDEINGE